MGNSKKKKINQNALPIVEVRHGYFGLNGLTKKQTDQHINLERRSDIYNLPEEFQKTLIMKNKLLSLGTILLGSFALLSMTIIKSENRGPWAVPTEYQNMKNPYADVDDDENIGRIVYSKNCKFCHGSKGKGDGPQGKLLKTPVADFTQDSFKDQTDGSIYYKIYTGRNEMPSFEKIITDEEDLWMVVNYIKGL